MSFDLVVPQSCGENPPNQHHPPLLELSNKPLRVSIFGPKKDIEKLFASPDAQPLPTKQPIGYPHGNSYNATGVRLAKLLFVKIYGREVDKAIPNDFVVSDEYYGWEPKMGEPGPVVYVRVSFAVATLLPLSGWTNSRTVPA